ncbi:MAG TPA: hypothetical protein VFY03_01870, partial [Woeseiaceae bacterium]|nr:hypothetical protein [Woeseiaceae bacterium]
MTTAARHPARYAAVLASLAALTLVAGCGTSGLSTLPAKSGEAAAARSAEDGDHAEAARDYIGLASARSVSRARSANAASRLSHSHRAS